LFTIYLPAFPEEIASEVIPTNAIRGGKARILLMDDDDGVITIVTQFLSYLGYESETARDGAEAIEKFTRAMKETKPFSAVILDLLVTNGMGGKDALAALKEMDPHVRAVLATGYLDDPVVLNFHEHGFSELIKKPFRIEELSRVLHRVLS
jgi:DNA-binding NtrC family response regulator